MEIIRERFSKKKIENGCGDRLIRWREPPNGNNDKKNKRIQLVAKLLLILFS
jgi:hypothetical protein